MKRCDWLMQQRLRSSSLLGRVSQPVPKSPDERLEHGQMHVPEEGVGEAGSACNQWLDFW